MIQNNQMPYLVAPKDEADEDDLLTVRGSQMQAASEIDEIG